MNAMDLYRHKALQPGKRIRILHLKPALEMTASIDSYLQEVELDWSPPFEALSYVWGAKVGDQEIFCEGKTLLVTANCLSALRHLRYKFETRVLWVDSICIDQTSISERSHQVNLMGDVYKYASKVLIWLGSGNPDTDKLLSQRKTTASVSTLKDKERSVPQDLSSSRGSKQSIHEVVEKDPVLWDTPGTRPPEYLSIQSRKETGKSTDPGWEYLLDSDWFCRVWTAQEYILASTPVLVCGSQSIDWEAFDIWSNMLKSKQTGSVSSLLSLKTIYDQMQVRPRGPSNLLVDNEGQKMQSKSTGIENPYIMDWNWAARWSKVLSMVCNAIRHRLSSDPKDQVYGFYAILRDLGMILPDPNYNKSLDEVYEELTFSVIDAARTLSILFSFPGLINRPGSPSWVPDWSGGGKPGTMPYDQFGRNKRGRFKSSFILERVSGQLKLLGTIREDLVTFGEKIPQAEVHSSWEDEPDEIKRKTAVALWLYEQLRICENFPNFSDDTSSLENFLWAFAEPELDSKDDLERLYSWYERDLRTIAGIYESVHDPKKKDILFSALKEPKLRDTFPAYLEKSDLMTMSSEEVLEIFFRASGVIKSLDVIWHKAVGFQQGRPIMTNNGWIGISRCDFKKGDCLALIHGCMEPMILRRLGQNYSLVGFASMRGIADDEYPIRGSKDRTQQIILI